MLMLLFSPRRHPGSHQGCRLCTDHPSIIHARRRPQLKGDIKVEHPQITISPTSILTHLPQSRYRSSLCSFTTPIQSNRISFSLSSTHTPTHTHVAEQQNRPLPAACSADRGLLVSLIIPFGTPFLRCACIPSFYRPRALAPSRPFPIPCSSPVAYTPLTSSLIRPTRIQPTFLKPNSSRHTANTAHCTHF